MNNMKTLILLSFFLLAGCDFFNNSPNDPVPETPVTVEPVLTDPMAIYNASGATGIHAKQENGVNFIIKSPTVIGTVLRLDVGGCYFSVDALDYDPVNADFWVAQPITIEYDPDIVNCQNKMICGVTAIDIVGTSVEALFNCAVLP